MAVDSVDRERAIQRQELVQDAGKVCGWWIAPNSRPEDLATHLIRAGFTQVEQV